MLTTENRPAFREVAAALPLISIVTPSYNQGAFLEETLRSVLEQGYPRLEYLVLDGGSTDASPAIIRRYADRLAYWTSERDGGQYDAIDRGLRRASGEIMGWLNSDDKQMPWTLGLVAEIFATFPHIEWLTAAHPVRWNARGQVVGCGARVGFSRELFFRGGYLPGQPWFARGYIQQESTFWRRSLWERAGGRMRTDLRYAGDFELWARFFEHAELYTVDTLLGGIRKHGQQKTAQHLDRYHAEARAVLEHYRPRTPGRIESRARYLATRLLHDRVPTLVPASLRRLLVRAGALFPVPVVCWDGAAWRVEERFVI